MIKLNITKDELNDLNRFNEILRIALQQHTIDVIQTVSKDKKYYRGELPISKHTINKAKYICDMATEMFIGELPDFTTYSEKEKERKKLFEFNKKIRNSGFGKEFYNVGLNASIAGTGYLLLYTEEGDTFPRFVSLDPELTNVVYDTHVKPKPLFAFTLVRQVEYLNNIETAYYRAYVYTDTMFFNLRTKSISDLTVYADMTGTTADLQLIEFSVPHNFAFVPLVEFKNNELMYGDARPVYELIDAYNGLQNNRITNVDDMVKYVLMLKNVRIGNDEEQQNFISMLKNQRVLALEGDNADAKFLQNALDQTDLQRLVDDLNEQIEMVSRVPNFNSAEFAQNSSEPALKLKLKGFLDLAKEKERQFTASLSEVLFLILAFVGEYGGREAIKYMFDMEEIEIEYSHNLPSNDMDKINQFVALNQIGLLNKRYAIQQLSWVRNIDEYLNDVEPSPNAQAEMLRNGGNNPTNFQRQQDALANQGSQDNQANFTRGQAQDLVNPEE